MPDPLELFIFECEAVLASRFDPSGCKATVDVRSGVQLTVIRVCAFINGRREFEVVVRLMEEVVELLPRDVRPCWSIGPFDPESLGVYLRIPARRSPLKYPRRTNHPIDFFSEVLRRWIRQSQVLQLASHCDPVRVPATDVKSNLHRLLIFCRERFLFRSRLPSNKPILSSMSNLDARRGFSPRYDFHYRRDQSRCTLWSLV